MPDAVTLALCHGGMGGRTRGRGFELCQPDRKNVSDL